MPDGEEISRKEVINLKPTLTDVSLGFGLVNIPVRIMPAVSGESSRGISFCNVHSACGTRVKAPKTCPTCQKELQKEEMQKSYEVAKGQYLPITEQDLQCVPLKTLRLIDVKEFVDEKEIDTRHYADTPYFLVPDKGGAKAFWLFLTAMKGVGKVGVVKFVLREKEHLGIIKPFGDRCLMLQTCLYADDIHGLQDFMVSPMECSQAEMEMATTLISGMSAEWKPEQYHDEWKDAMEKVIEAKAAGQPIAVPAVAAPAPTTDLSASLRASVEAVLAAKAKKDAGVLPTPAPSPEPATAPAGAPTVAISTKKRGKKTE